MRLTSWWLVLCVALCVVVPRAAFALPVDSSFTETQWTNVPGGNLTGMAWAPDGSNRLFVTVKDGSVRIIKYGSPPTLVTTAFATLSPIYTNSECGLIGLAFDPNFQVNHYVYFFVTVSSSEQQIIRYTAQGDVGTNKTVIVSGLPTAGQNHDGGSLGIGPDGKLYWGIGDNGNGTGVNADLASMAAKIGRANLDGSAPNDNPFFDGGGPNADYIWARGVRNPFTMTFQPATGALWLDVVGTNYEQTFIITKGVHAGYNTYENNQPGGYITPTIKYRTNGTDSLDLTASGAVRNAGVVTFTTTAAHGLRQGELITIAGVTDTGFNGDVYVASTPSATTFTAAQVGSDATSGNGTATTQALGGCITGGTFYAGTQFGPAYRGNYFFGDYNSGNVMRAVLASPTAIASLDVWATGISSYIDMETGPDGALYYIGIGGAVYRTVFNTTAQAIVVSKTDVWMSEGGDQSIGVRLATAPTANVTVSTARTAGDTDINVSAGATLTFTTANWSVPQPVTITSTTDADMVMDTATISLSSSGLTTQSVTVNAVEGPSNALVLSMNALTINEGASGTFTVALAAQPTATTTVNVARSGGDMDITVSSGTTLTFTPSTYATAQTVTIAAAEDPDAINDTATISVTASGLATRMVAVTAIDNDPVAPTITSTPVTSAVVNAPYSYTVTATGLPTPKFSLTTKPTGMTIDDTTGVIAWTPTSVGSFPVTVVASNGTLPDATQVFMVGVESDAAPTCSLTKPRPNAIVSGTASEFFGDGFDDVGTTQAEFFVDGTLGYTDVGTQGHYHFKGSHNLWDTTAYADGSHLAKFRVTDTIGQTCEIEVNVTVANGMDAGTPDAGTPDAGTPEAGTPYAGTSDAGTQDAGTQDSTTHGAGKEGSGAHVADPPAEQLKETVAQLERALTVRVRVEQAIGVLAERHRLRPRQAFELLRSASRARGARVSQTAGEVVASVTNPLLRIPEELARQPEAHRGRSSRHPRGKA
jgi:glucose/arabinose dehydrogenase